MEVPGDLTSSKAIDMHIARYGLIPMARTMDRGCLLPTEQYVTGHYPQQLLTLSSSTDNILNNLNVYLISNNNGVHYIEISVSPY